MKLKKLFKLLWSKMISNWNNLNGYSSYIWLCNKSIRPVIFPPGIGMMIWVGILVYKSCLSYISFQVCSAISHLIYFWFSILCALFFEPFFYRRGLYRRDCLKVLGRRFDLFWDVSHSSFYSLFQQVWIVQILYLFFLLASYHLATHLVCSRFSPLCLQRQFKDLLLSQAVK